MLLDIDGTILTMDYRKSRETFKTVFNKVFGTEVLDEDLPPFSGSTDLGIVKHISEKKGIPFYTVLSSKNEMWRSMTDSFAPLFVSNAMTLHPNVLELIQLLEKEEDIVLGLLTGNHREAARGKLRAFAVDDKFVDGAFGCEHYDRNLLPRIAWDRFSEIFPDSHFGPENTVIIGDSPKDIECAKASGAKVISVATGNYSFADLNTKSPDLLLEKLYEANTMLDLIKSLVDKSS